MCSGWFDLTEDDREELLKQLAEDESSEPTLSDRYTTGEPTDRYHTEPSFGGLSRHRAFDELTESEQLLAHLRKIAF